MRSISINFHLSNRKFDGAKVCLFDIHVCSLSEDISIAENLGADLRIYNFPGGSKNVFYSLIG